MERPDIIIANLGYANPAVQPDDAESACRAGDIGVSEPEEQLGNIRVARLLNQQEAGVDWIPVGDFTLCDRVLDHAIAFGLAPKTLLEAAARGPAALARALAEAPDGTMPRTKTGYGHAGRRIVPELAADAAPRLTANPWAAAFREARAHLSALPVPVMIGPYTFAKLAGELAAGEALERLAPVYAEALRELHEAGAEWVQLEEPELARPVPAGDWPHIEKAWQTLHDAAPQLRLMLQTMFGVPDQFGRLLALPAAGIGLDFTADGGRALEIVAKHGFPSGRVLGAGIVDGRSVWRSDLRAACALLGQLRQLVPETRLALQPNCSLAHAPAPLRSGQAPGGLPRHAWASADVKLGELRVLRTALTEGLDAVWLDLADSDVVQDMLRVLLPAAMTDGGPAVGTDRPHGAGTQAAGGVLHAYSSSGTA